MTTKPCRLIVNESADQVNFEDEALETLWELRERQGTVLLEALEKEMQDEKRMATMQQSGALITVEEGKVVLTAQGESRARDITRRHRLAERLFYDVLDLEDFEADACRLEHAISQEVEEAICTLLGHPPLCPHGKPIPKGKCCELYTKKVKPLSQSLRELEVGKRARVLFITVPSIQRLASLGLVPGANVKLSQRKPSFVIEIDESTVALDEEIAKGIYVKPL